MHFTDSVALKALLFTTTFSASASAFWRMPCRARSGLARIDPLVSPGTMGEHAHAIHGGSGKLILTFPCPNLWVRHALGRT
jgi:hypothetical protein